MESQTMKIIMGIIKAVLGFLLVIIVATVGTLVFLTGFGLLHGLLAGAKEFFYRSDFIVYIIPEVDFFIFLIAFILLIIVLVGMKLITPVENQEIYFEEIDSTSKTVSLIEKVLFRIICLVAPYYLVFWHLVGVNKGKILSAIFAISLLLGYYSLTDYSVFNQDTIVQHSFFNPRGQTYSWTEIEEVRVGVKKNKNDNDYYYIMQFEDKTTINLRESGSSHLDVADVFLLVDDKVKELGINKIIDRSNLDKWGNEYGPDYVEKVRRLFED